jgi:RNA polymerase sigma factor (sigma-70 family)
MIGSMTSAACPKEIRAMDDEDGCSVTGLVQAAAGGQEAAWGQLVERFTPLVVSVVKRYRLGPEDAADVEQTVWLRLVQNLRRLREPAALPGWIQTTVRNEALRVVSARRTVPLIDEFSMIAEQDPPDADLLAGERRDALLGAVAQLPGRQYDLVMMLITDPPPSYEEISAKLGIPKGSIGPTRVRAMERLRGLLEAISPMTPLEG